MSEFNLIVRAKKDPGSRKKAIDAMCFHCFGGTEGGLPDPGYIQCIRSCTSLSCPLHPWRPYSGGAKSAEEMEEELVDLEVQIVPEIHTTAQGAIETEEPEATYSSLETEEKEGLE